MEPTFKLPHLIFLHKTYLCKINVCLCIILASLPRIYFVNLNKTKGEVQTSLRVADNLEMISLHPVSHPKVDENSKPLAYSSFSSQGPSFTHVHFALKHKLDWYLVRWPINWRNRLNHTRLLFSGDVSPLTLPQKTPNIGRMTYMEERVCYIYINIYSVSVFGEVRLILLWRNCWTIQLN